MFAQTTHLGSLLKVPVHLYKVKPALGGYTSERYSIANSTKPVHLKEITRSLEAKHEKLSYY